MTDVRHAAVAVSLAAGLAVLPVLGTAPAPAHAAAVPSGPAASTRTSRGVVVISTVVDYDAGTAAGSGIVLCRHGRHVIVVTNHHVVGGATRVKVTAPGSGRRIPARVVGYDATHDIAVLDLHAGHRLRPVATHRSVRVGAAVTSVGNAEGRGRLVAETGRVLKRGVTIDPRTDEGTNEHLSGLIKSSTRVVPGDSGGALLDSHHRVVGMTVAAATDPHRSIGFAIAIARVKRIAARIIHGPAGGSATITIGSHAALELSIDDHRQGLYVAHVVRRGPAARAGIAVGDLITSVGGVPVQSYDQLAQALSAYRPGEQTQVGWTDTTGAPRAATVTLGTAPVG